MKFICRSCKNTLTKDLIDTQVDYCDEDGEDLLPEGITNKVEDFSGDKWAINSKDILSMTVTKELSRINGCCDLDGCDGPNLRCGKCDQYVATARYDCWLPRYVIMDPEKTELIA